MLTKAVFLLVRRVLGLYCVCSHDDINNVETTKLEYINVILAICTVYPSDFMPNESIIF